MVYTAFCRQAFHHIGEMEIVGVDEDEGIDVLRFQEVAYPFSDDVLIVSKQFSVQPSFG
jgi:hypothetical protein